MPFEEEALLCRLPQNKRMSLTVFGIIRVAKEDGKTNIADIFTKLVTGILLYCHFPGWLLCMWRDQTKPSQT